MRAGKAHGPLSDGEVNVEILSKTSAVTMIFVLQSDLRANQRQPDGAGDHGGRRRSVRPLTPRTAMPYAFWLRASGSPSTLRPRWPISARKLTLTLRPPWAWTRVRVTMDLHAEPDSGLLQRAPVDNIYATPILLADIWKQSTTTCWWCRPM